MFRNFKTWHLTLSHCKATNTYRKFALYLLTCLLPLTLTSCFKTNKTPAQLPQEQTENSSSLGTTNNHEDVNKWFIPMISEYLMYDELPPQTCSDNTATIAVIQPITTQAEINALATAKIIDGDLILDPSAPNLDFSPLSQLTEIIGNFELANNATQTTLTGFDCLATVGASFNIYNNAALTSIPDFSALTSVGVSFFILNNVALTSISGFSALKSVPGNFYIQNNDALTSITGFSVLTSAGVDFRIIDNNALTSISAFPNLTSAGGNFYISGNVALTNITGFSALTSAGLNFYISNNYALESITAFSALDSVGLDFYINNHDDALMSITGFSALTSVGGFFNIYGNDVLMSITGFSALTSVSGNFHIVANNALTSIAGFYALDSIGGSFRITDNAALTSVADFSVLTSVGEDFNIDNNAALTSVADFSVLASVGEDFRITENDVLMSIPDFSALTSVGVVFVIDNNDVLTSIAGFPALISVGEVFRIFNNAALMSISGFSGLTSVGGGYFVIDKNAFLTSITGFNQLDSGDIIGNTSVSNNYILDCQSPDPHFTPVHVSTGNSLNCNTDVAVVAFSYVLAGSPISWFTFNASGGTVTSSHPTTGIYTLTFAGLTLGSDSNVQISALSNPIANSYCSVKSVSGETVTVHCYNPAPSPNILADSAFTIAIVDKTIGIDAKVTAYAVANEPTNPNNYTPIISTSYNGYGGGITATRSTIGNYSMTFSNGSIGQEANVQVTALDANAFCNIDSWNSSTVNIDCFDLEGESKYSEYSLTVIDSTLTSSGSPPLPLFITTSVVGYAHYDSQNGITSSYNQSGGDVTGSGSAPVLIDFSGLNLTSNRQIQVSVHDDTLHNFYCVLGPTGTITNSSKVAVSCYDENENPAVVGFDILVVQ